MPMSPRLLRPRAAGGFDPRSIANIALWLEATPDTLFTDQAGTTRVTADSDPVGRWTDRSGANRHIYQSVANNRPTYRTSIVNGRNVVRFDGSNDILVGDDTTSDLPFPYSLFCVYQSSDAAGSVVGSTRQSGVNVAENIRKSAANTLMGLQQNGGATDSSATVTAADASWHVAELVFSGTTSSLTFSVRVNGGTAANMSTSRARDNTGAVRRLEVGAAFAAGVSIDHMQGDIAEIVAYGRTLTTNERSTVLRYLGARYGITVA